MAGLPHRGFIPNYRPIVPSEAMVGAVSRAILAKHADVLELFWLCAEGFVPGGHASVGSNFGHRAGHLGGEQVWFRKRSTIQTPLGPFVIGISGKPL